MSGEDLWNAVNDNNTNHFIELLQSGADLDWQDITGNTALIVASINRNREIVNLLIRAGADVNTHNHNRYTPLMYASKFGYTEIVNALIGGQANIDSQDIGGIQLLYYLLNLVIQI